MQGHITGGWKWRDKSPKPDRFQTHDVSIRRRVLNLCAAATAINAAELLCSNRNKFVQRCGRNFRGSTFLLCLLESWKLSKKWKQRNPITKKCCKSWKSWNNFLLPWLMLSEEIFLMSFFIRVKALVAASRAKLLLWRKKFDYPTLWWNFFSEYLEMSLLLFSFRT